MNFLFRSCGFSVNARQGKDSIMVHVRDGIFALHMPGRNTLSALI